MATHRTEPKPRWWRTFLRDRVAPILTDAVQPFKVHEVVTCSSDDFYLEPVHPWQAIPCLLCAQPAAAYRVYCVTVLGASVRSTGYYRPGAQAYLIHSDHGHLEGIEVWIAAHKRERPGCPCHSRSATVADSLPYHQL